MDSISIDAIIAFLQNEASACPGTRHAQMYLAAIEKLEWCEKRSCGNCKHLGVGNVCFCERSPLFDYCVASSLRRQKMREIKYKVFVDTGEFRGICDVSSIDFLSAPKVTYLEPKEFNGSRYYDYEEMYVGENCKLLQFTGLKDKNGVDVYEGDIISYKTYDNDTGDYVELAKLPVKYDDGHFRLCDGKWSVCILQATKNEVIGNIYEHPHLLKPQNT